MLDLSFIRKNLPLVRQKMQERGTTVALDEFERLDSERRRLILESEKLKYLRNTTSDEIAALKKAGARRFSQDCRDERRFDPTSRR